MKIEEMTREELLDFVGERECVKRCRGICDDCPFDLPKVNASMDAFRASDAILEGVPNEDYLLDTLAALTGALAAISFIMRACRELANRPQEEDLMDDRVAQVNWLKELAVNIAENLGSGTAKELVAFAEGEGAVWGIDWPDWYDEHDRRLLTEFVADAL